MTAEMEDERARNSVPPTTAPNVDVDRRHPAVRLVGLEQPVFLGDRHAELGGCGRDGELGDLASPHQRVDPEPNRARAGRHRRVGVKEGLGPGELVEVVEVAVDPLLERPV